MSTYMLEFHGRDLGSLKFCVVSLTVLENKTSKCRTDICMTEIQTELS